MRGKRGRTGNANIGGQTLGHLEIEIGRLEQQRLALGAQQDIRQYRNGIAALDDAMHMTKRLQQSRSFEGNLHGVVQSRFLFDLAVRALDAPGGGLWRGRSQIASLTDIIPGIAPAAAAAEPLPALNPPELT